MSSLTGGCIHRVDQITLDDGTTLVVKSNTADHLGSFEEEAASLRVLERTGTVLVPAPLAVVGRRGVAVLLMRAIRSGRGTPEAWQRLGRDLAALHLEGLRALRSGLRPHTPSGGYAADRKGRYAWTQTALDNADPPPVGYGFSFDNHLGTTHQPNAWCDDWVRFNAENRLGHQLELARRGDRLRSSEAAGVQQVIAKLGMLIPAAPKPALIHGDLWSGNAIAAIDGRGAERIALIDPACSIGDGWADIAMMRLFGGFPPDCFTAYASMIDDSDRLETRIAVYQLYHVLNHVNLFGRGYVEKAMGLVKVLSAP